MVFLQVHERHRHRYEVNPSVVAELEAAGMKFVGRNTDGTGERMEVLELEDKSHPYFMGAQVSSIDVDTAVCIPLQICHARAPKTITCRWCS